MFISVDLKLFKTYKNISKIYTSLIKTFPLRGTLKQNIYKIKKLKQKKKC